jgi:hypothetical protein
MHKVHTAYDLFSHSCDDLLKHEQKIVMVFMVRS